MNDEASSIYGYTCMFISKANSFDKRLHCHEILVRMQIPKVLSAGMPLLLLLFLSSKKAFYVLSYDFQVCVCHMPMVFNCRHLLCVQDR